MSEDVFRELLRERAEVAQISVTPLIEDSLAAYFRLLAHWNTRINLTSLSLDPPTAQGVDRLFIEPLAAAPLIRSNVSVWFDLGSGGGSPAIPLQLVKPARRLIMVESRERKAAFLHEAIREIPVPATEVEVSRIEEVAADNRNQSIADLITVRAVRMEASMIGWIQTLLRFNGQVVLFGAEMAISHLPRGLELMDAIGTSGRGLVVLRKAGL